jgi:hypothetical protein
VHAAAHLDSDASAELKPRKHHRFADRDSVTYTLRSVRGRNPQVHRPDRVLLLGGGTKATQAIDIATARQRLNAHRGKAKH